MEYDSENKTEPVNKKESILGLVVYSPVIYLLIFLMSFVAHIYYPVGLPGEKILMPIGLLLIFFSPALILWSQYSIKKFVEREQKKEGDRVFYIGPYKYTRNPTYLGLALLTLGFSFISSSFLMLIGTIISFHVVNFTVVKKEEELMHKKYGEEYSSYKSQVRPWF